MPGDLANSWPCPRWTCQHEYRAQAARFDPGTESCTVNGVYALAAMEASSILQDAVISGWWTQQFTAADFANYATEHTNLGMKVARAKPDRNYAEFDWLQQQLDRRMQAPHFMANVWPAMPEPTTSRTTLALPVDRLPVGTAEAPGTGGVTRGVGMGCSGAMATQAPTHAARGSLRGLRERGLWR